MQNQSGAVKLLRIAAALWLLYIGLSATIDYSLKNPGHIESYLYIADAAIAVFFLGMSFWSWIRERLGKAFLPLMVVLICALPTLANQVFVRYLFTGAFPPPEAMLSRVVPFLLIALILTAWQYKWQHVLIFCVAVALVNVVLLWVFVDNNKGAFSDGLFAIMTQIIGFLIVGFFINVMVGWLNDQKRSLEEANLKLTNYAKTLEDLAISRERSRIAQELHDTLSHTLSGLSVQLETMKAYWDVDRATARTRLDKSLAAARSGLEETRRILLALRAKPLEDLGLVPAIRQMAEEAAARSGISLNMALAAETSHLSYEEEQCIFRVAQEAITNALKHSMAKVLTIRLEVKEDRAALTVQDDGVGFDAHAHGGTGHLGLLGMKERVEFVKGKLEIASQSGNGTMVQLTIREKT